MKKKIALVTGGYSGEAVISYQSAIAIEKNIDTEKWDCYKIDINANGWFYMSDDSPKIAVDKNDFSITINHTKIIFDAVLISLHGTPGEDGKLQGYFDCLKIPYTGCNASVSALTFNKHNTVSVAAFSNIYVAKSVLLLKNTFVNADEIIAQLQFPVIVKPNNGGSSIGISKVNNPSDEINAAIKNAFNEDDQVLVEEFISGREFTIGVYKSTEKIITLPITEIITKKDFFDFDAKYKGESEEITPAKVDESIAQKIRDIAKKIYLVFNCKGIVRIDFIYSQAHNNPFMLEINTVPGQSAASIVPQQVVASGILLKDFYSSLIEACFI